MSTGIVKISEGEIAHVKQRCEDGRSEDEKEVKARVQFVHVKREHVKDPGTINSTLKFGGVHRRVAVVWHANTRQLMRHFRMSP